MAKKERYKREDYMAANTQSTTFSESCHVGKDQGCTQ